MGHITDEEVERSKSQLKASLLLALDDSTAIAEDIGRQVVNTGYRLSPEEVLLGLNRLPEMMLLIGPITG